ncbi:2-amino-4-hydroxy-6-hydroxymethyldihydropteridine diphosphokinase [Pedobacter chitinilyticus]|uniref:2-amino-4-hydroxy-6-hydroxymethyldihydropteridine pyrophosphokinase n=1 Tax=Pedobacter chitinilyticus TaxID=2233776 RepID=A0A443YW28_9SPHI|nr:2-amino-4-hydroxy-6-hydroxymethyldihydropteridine diphosphokinase [Pedobacter chitinilyticus]RWU08211.1 2-amino-4-hydroxy-6-hydroxymethyldihydropteridine diphosphokinase [Pedobacter chitinilyticus]
MKLDSRDAYLLLGTNLGDRLENLNTAISYVDNEVGAVFAKSSVYETEAWGKTDQPGFLNQAIAVKSNMPPLQLLQTLLAIEQKMGRVRLERWGERLIDIDLIFYGDLVLSNGEVLQLPHPEMHHRRFVLEPLNEIAENFIHPVFKEKISSILANLTDKLTVQKI